MAVSTYAGQAGDRDLVREQYYEHRAPVYDITSYRGDPTIDAELDREASAIGRILGAIPTGTHILDVGCGTATWTRFLAAPVVAVDQAEAMLRIARGRMQGSAVVRGRCPGLPFADRAFDLIFSANFYGLLRPDERIAFLREAQRLAPELIVLDLRAEGDHTVEQIEQRRVDGATYPIYRRRFAWRELCSDLEGEPLYVGKHFLAVWASTRIASSASAQRGSSSV